MLIEGLMTMTLLTADSPRGSLDIQVDQGKGKCKQRFKSI